MRGMIVVLIAMLTGCEASPLSDDWVPRRALARDLPAHHVPPDYMEAIAVERASQSRPPEQGELSLRRALELALWHNPDLKPIAWERHAAGARLTQASLPPNPVAGFMVDDFGGTGHRGGFDGAESTLSLSQLIETADKRGKRIALAEADRQRVLWDYEAKRVEVAAETAQRFIDVLAGQERVTLARESLALAEQTYKLVDDRVKSGVAPAVERDKAQVRLSVDRIALHRAERALDTSRTRLAALFGEPARFTQVTGRLDELRPFPPREALEAGIKENPQLARFAAELAMRQAAIDLAEARAVPDVTGKVGVKRMNEDDDTVYLAEIMVPLPLFDRNQGGIREARINLGRTQREQDAAWHRVRTMLTQAHNELAAAHHEARVLRDEAVPAARRAFDAMRAAYESGKATYLDVLDAQRTYIESRRDLVNALAMVHVATAMVEGITGESLNP